MKAYGYERSEVAATVIVPLLMERFHPRSIIDFGCGPGYWLAEFRKQGAPTIVGLELPGIESLPGIEIHSQDISSPTMATELQAKGAIRFDLALCLEVVEHLNEEAGFRLVDALTNVAPVIVFSAAIPGQGGDGHINERWQSYWVCQFEQRGFKAFDLIRPLVWYDQSVAFWYRQNILIFISNTAISMLNCGEETSSLFIADVVHPELFWKR